MVKASRQRYRKQAASRVTAVQLDLETEGFYYQKWGARQHCKQGDWLVNNNGECYTVDQLSFANTYRELSPGCYQKTSLVWARPASEPGSIETKEGRSGYQAGDYLVANNADGSDAYAISKSIFEAEYRLVDG